MSASTSGSTDPLISLTRNLRDLPLLHNYRFTDESRVRLLQDLFASLAGNNEEYLPYFFPTGVPKREGRDAWSLSKAQGAVEGAEYSAAARGKPCGHIFKNGEATYRCKTCSLDETSVLCAKCFDSSDHRNHSVFVSISPGNSGCCDCGDAEAWRRPVKCAIHTAYETQFTNNTNPEPFKALPENLKKSIRATISKALDYVCDVISCSPEQLRLAKSVQLVKEDEENSRLLAKQYEYGENETKDPEFALILWNDEKHTVKEVQDQVGRACKKPKDWCLKRAEETDLIGRSIVDFGTDIEDLLAKSKIIERIKLTMTVRSSRDTFREQMCGTIIEWLVDIAGCAVGPDPDIMRTLICEELLGVWNIGSKAWNIEVGMKGIDDHEHAESEKTKMEARFLLSSPEVRFFRQQEEEEDRQARLEEGDAEDEEEEEEEEEDDGPDDPLGESMTADNMEVDGENQPAESALDNDGDVSMGTNTTANDAPSSALTLATARPLNLTKIPKTPGHQHERRRRHDKPGIHWLEKAQLPYKTTPYYEDLRQRVRLDWLIMFDLRMWKKARVDLRELYIGTVVAIPPFKRILGLRFAGLYTTLSQLYLIADREPDHSIINLSLQMLTAPSITTEVVARGNFLTSLMAILYTFLTTRQVGHPSDVNPNATLAFDAGSLTNRRMYHFFQDMKYLFGSDYVKEQLRVKAAPVMQFLDLVRLHQGICPNTRAIGTHVEYESEAWICASLITREINKLCRQFADAFRRPNAGRDAHLANALQLVAQNAIRHSAGLERQRFTQAEIKEDIVWDEIPCFAMERGVGHGGRASAGYFIIKYQIEKQSISFHHAMHYALSWLIEVGNGMEPVKLQKLLMLQPEDQDSHPDDDLHILFDYPLRVCVWLSQMKAGMWVRNGYSLKHQMNTYKGVGQRDLTYNRDIFMLQVACSIVPDPRRWLLTMIDRFSLVNWFRGDFKPPTTIEPGQVLDLVEDFFLLLIALLNERLLLISPEEEHDIPTLQLRREITHVLCTKPASFSDISQRIPERLQDLENFQDVLAEMATYKPPDGLSDSGIYELREPFKEFIDPYILHNTKNQREEAELTYKKHIATKLKIPENSVVYEPNLRPIKTGVFQNLADFTKSPMFVQCIYFALVFGATYKERDPPVQDTRIDSFMHAVLYLTQIAVAEDKTSEDSGWELESFVSYAIEREVRINGEIDDIVVGDETTRKAVASANSVVKMLYKLKLDGLHETCIPIIDMLLKRMQGKRPRAFAPLAEVETQMQTKEAVEAQRLQHEQEEMAKKKELAKQRQANIMAQFQQQQQSFLKNNFDTGMDDDDWDDDVVDEEMDFSSDKAKPTWNFPTGDCIMCSEQLNDSKAFGTFAMIQESNVLRQTEFDDPDYVYEVLSTPENLDQSAESLRPFGVARMNREYIKKMAEDGTEISVLRQGLGKGYPRRTGSTRFGPVATGCGHMMHYTCFESHIVAIQRRHHNQISRAHPENLEKNEFLCPLCKALGNAFLPILWKPKNEETVQEIVETKSDFSTWIGQEIGPAISRLEKVVEGNGKVASAKFREQFLEYGSRNFIDNIASKLGEVSEQTFMQRSASSESSHETPAQINHTLVVPMGGNFEQQLAIGLQIGAHSSVASVQSRPPDHPTTGVEGIYAIYKRLRDSMTINKIPTNRPIDKNESNDNDLPAIDTLMRILGFTLSTMEILYRGVEPRPGLNLIERTPEHMLKYLRVLAETVQSYVAFGGLKDDNTTSLQFKEIQEEQMLQLFVGHPQTYASQKSFFQKAAPLLAQDSFVFLTECSLCLCPALNQDFKHIMTLCYIAEIVKAVVTISRNSYAINLDAARDDGERFERLAQELSYTEADISKFTSFVDFVTQSCEVDAEGDTLSTPSPVLFRHLISKYINTFLRKCMYLLHSRYTVTFPDDDTSSKEPEHVRLTTLLQLPSLESIFCIQENGDDGAEIVRSMISGWCRHWQWYLDENSRKTPTPGSPLATPTLAYDLATRISHPSILELVGLPLHYDALVEEAMKRRCPNTGRELGDPVVCLLCGDIFCSQSVCCMDENRQGGANQHLAVCGRNIGIFINIRKCHVLYLHGGQGAWFVAPYLDKHGEVDPNLRRNRQLFLNQKRYDAHLRAYWLQHLIPTFIARRLEPDFNTGGWESL